MSKLYQEIKEFVLDNIQTIEDKMSMYWSEELKDFNYIYNFDSERIFEQIRRHCYHLTGELAYQYKDHHKNSKNKRLIEIYEKLRSIDLNSSVFVGEKKNFLGSFGLNLDNLEDDLVNIDILKYYESNIFLKNNTNFYEDINKFDRVIDIGGGWGGYLYTIKRLSKDTKISIIDLPYVLPFSTYYLINYFQTDYSLGKINDSALSFFSYLDYPENIFKNSALVNTSSFQEMTRSSIKEYIKKFIKNDGRSFYSFNKEFNTNNIELGNLKNLFLNCFKNTEYQIIIADRKIQSQSKIKKILLRNFKNKNIDYFHFYAYQKK
tara:strand:- start:1492 stop:2451 length:960 start_codon:yes stop_codon:yes gene_type:complete